ncbi:uncharacterized protein LOC121417417 [Lytechinus variegatus]|uniref:uncharacterized protein LOC121417417 n=1 Tax=Lytechinus variegatus TaxID=7654 RepID=UPI001BB1C806|nr:uncharacterized protein LOC121417417 [Lytechinus variegatus]
MTERTMKETDTLKKISNEYYNGALPPEKGLVFYLLDNGASLDIKDDAGNLPIDYAKDHVINQMILLRSPIEDIVYSKDAPPSTSNLSVEVKSSNNQKVDLGYHDVSIFIPPGAVLHDDKGEITLTVLRELPGFDLHEDESVACYGIRCDPPHMVFQYPVEIKIPHSSVVINPDQVKPDIVSRVWDSVNDLPRTSRQRSSNSSDEPPFCRIYERHLELYITHCAEWWVLIPLEQQVIRRKLMCTPYIPDKIEKSQEFSINLQMYNDLPGTERILREEAKQQFYHRCHCSVPFSIEPRSGDVIITCQRDGEEIESQVLSVRDLQTKLKQCVSLYVPPCTDDVDFTAITITIAQSGKHGISRSIAFVPRYIDGPEWPSPSEHINFSR